MGRSHDTDPLGDPARLAVLEQLQVLGTPPELLYEDLARLAAAVVHTDVAAVNFVDADEHWSKAVVGVEGGHGTRVDASVSLCAATIRAPDGVLVIEDAHGDPAWSAHPLVAGGPRVRAYAGAAIVVAGQRVGVVCGFGPTAQAITPEDVDALRALARQAASHLELRRHTLALHGLATTDRLTGLANRALLLDRLTLALAGRSRHGGEVGVVFGDVDGLKRVNDEHGHAAGDQLLLDVAQELRASVRVVDTVARISGDEFVVVCPGLSGRDELEGIVGRVRGRDGARASARLSLGTVLAADGELPERVLARADQAMYAEKAARRSDTLSALA